MADFAHVFNGLSILQVKVGEKEITQGFQKLNEIFERFKNSVRFPKLTNKAWGNTININS